MLRTYDPFVIPAKSYRDTVPIETLDKYVRVKNLIECRDDIKSSIWYNNLTKYLETHGFAKHRHEKVLAWTNLPGYLLKLSKSTGSLGDLGD